MRNSSAAAPETDNPRLPDQGLLAPITEHDAEKQRIAQAVMQRYPAQYDFKMIKHSIVRIFGEGEKRKRAWKGKTRWCECESVGRTKWEGHSTGFLIQHECPSKGTWMLTNFHAVLDENKMELVYPTWSTDRISLSVSLSCASMWKCKSFAKQNRVYIPAWTQTLYHFCQNHDKPKLVIPTTTWWRCSGKTDTWFEDSWSPILLYKCHMWKTVTQRTW